jgi:hypothetical protein
MSFSVTLQRGRISYSYFLDVLTLYPEHHSVIYSQVIPFRELNVMEKCGGVKLKISAIEISTDQ